MSLKDITKFENMNNLSINVYGLTDKNKVQILRVSNAISNDNNWSNYWHVDLLYLTNKEIAHYALSKTLRLVSSQVYKSKHKSYS